MAETRYIIFLVDDSPDVMNALNWYLEHMKRPTDQLLFLTIIDPNLTTHVEAELPSFFSNSINELVEIARREAKAITADYQKRAKEAKLVNQSFVHLDDHTDQTLLTFADQYDPSLIIMPYRKVTRLRRFLRQSKYDFLLSNSVYPLIFIPPPAGNEGK